MNDKHFAIRDHFSWINFVQKKITAAASNAVAYQ